VDGGFGVVRLIAGSLVGVVAVAAILMVPGGPASAADPEPLIVNFSLTKVPDSTFPSPLPDFVVAWSCDDGQSGQTGFLGAGFSNEEQTLTLTTVGAGTRCRVSHSAPDDWSVQPPGDDQSSIVPAGGVKLSIVDEFQLQHPTFDFELFDDANGNGTTVGGTGAIPGIPVTLYDTNDNQLATAITDGQINNGQLGRHLNHGASAKVCFTLPTDRTITSSGWTSADPANQNRPCRTTSLNTNLTVDNKSTFATAIRIGAVQVRVFDDRDGDGFVIGDGDLGSEGWIIEVFRGGTSVETGTTDAAGIVHVDGLFAGLGHVVCREQRPGWFGTDLAAGVAEPVGEGLSLLHISEPTRPY